MTLNQQVLCLFENFSLSQDCSSFVYRTLLVCLKHQCPLFNAMVVIKKPFPPYHSLADDNAPSKQPVSSEEESKSLPAAEDVSGANAASSSTHV